MRFYGWLCLCFQTELIFRQNEFLSMDLFLQLVQHRRNRFLSKHLLKRKDLIYFCVPSTRSSSSVWNNFFYLISDSIDVGTWPIEIIIGAGVRHLHQQTCNKGDYRYYHEHIVCLLIALYWVIFWLIRKEWAFFDTL